MIPLTFIYNYFGPVPVFENRVTLILGFLLVILFFLMPKWIEKKKLIGNPGAVIIKSEPILARLFSSGEIFGSRMLLINCLFLGP
jgi:hypothetical protein